MQSSHLFQLWFVRASPVCTELKPKFKVISFHVHLKRQEIPIEILGPSLLDSIQDFLGKLGMKSHLHLV